MHRLVGSLLVLLYATALVAAGPNVVRVLGYDRGAKDRPAVGSALGFIVERDGFLLTSYSHLIDPRTGELVPVVRVETVEDDETRTYDARVIGVEPTLNFAVIQAESDRPFRASPVSHDRATAVGQPVFAFTGIGDDAKKVRGRLVALNSKECYQQSLTQTMFLAEMTIPDSGIGGPVFDENGDVVALYTGYEPPHDDPTADHQDSEQQTHLLPIFLALNIYDSIKDRKSLASPWTGFSVRTLNDDERRQFPVAQGVFTGGIALEYVWPDSPAAQLGLREGDILVRFASHPIHSPADFQKWLYMYGVGSDVALFILRDGVVSIYDYTIEERPASAVPQ